MTIYNFNLGIGWASSGVEYAQAYRAKVFRSLGYRAKFIFTDMFRRENIEHMTKNIGLEDEEVIWLYQYFTDFRIAPTTYQISALENTFAGSLTRIEKEEKEISYYFDAQNLVIKAHLTGQGFVYRAEYISGGNLTRCDYYSYARMFSEFFVPSDQKPELHLRRFYNEDGTTAYEEILEGEKEFFRIGENFYYTKEQFFRHFVQALQPGQDDIVIADRTTGIGQVLFTEHGSARLFVVVHADHYNEKMTDDDNIVWNNFYEYSFMHASEVACYITSTEVQRDLLRKQFTHYLGITPRVEAIPVGSLEKLRYPAGSRLSHAMLTASRLASEKHVDWLVRAVILAHRQIPDLTFDIYGKGGQEETIRREIMSGGAQSYIHLCGHKDLTSIYESYEGYLSASTGEGFGLTLMEAAGAGLPIIGLDVKYGNQCFIEDGKNGYLVSYTEGNTEKTVKELADRIVALFEGTDGASFSAESYRIAGKYLDVNVRNAWRELIGGDES